MSLLLLCSHSIGQLGSLIYVHIIGGNFHSSSQFVLFCLFQVAYQSVSCCSEPVAYMWCFTDGKQSRNLVKNLSHLLVVGNLFQPHKEKKVIFIFFLCSLLFGRVKGFVHRKCICRFAFVSSNKNTCAKYVKRTVP